MEDDFLPPGFDAARLTQAQRAFLKSCGCDYMQGYLTGMPLDADRAAQDFI